MIAESVLATDAVSAGQSQFVARLNTRLISKGLSSILRRGELEDVMEFLRSVDKLGIRPSALFDNVAAEDLGVQCRRLVHNGRVEEFVHVMETLAGLFVNNVLDSIQQTYISPSLSELENSVLKFQDTSSISSISWIQFVFSRYLSKSVIQIWLLGTTHEFAILLSSRELSCGCRSLLHL